MSHSNVTRKKNATLGGCKIAIVGCSNAAVVVFLLEQPTRKWTRSKCDISEHTTPVYKQTFGFYSKKKNHADMKVLEIPKEQAATSNMQIIQCYRVRHHQFLTTTTTKPIAQADGTHTLLSKKDEVLTSFILIFATYLNIYHPS